MNHSLKKRKIESEIARTTFEVNEPNKVIKIYDEKKPPNFTKSFVDTFLVFYKDNNIVETYLALSKIFCFLRLVKDEVDTTELNKLIKKYEKKQQKLAEFNFVDDIYSDEEEEDLREGVRKMKRLFKN